MDFSVINNAAIIATYLNCTDKEKLKRICLALENDEDLYIDINKNFSNKPSNKDIVFAIYSDMYILKRGSIKNIEKRTYPFYSPISNRERSDLKEHEDIIAKVYLENCSANTLQFYLLYLTIKCDGHYEQMKALVKYSENIENDFYKSEINTLLNSRDSISKGDFEILLTSCSLSSGLTKGIYNDFINQRTFDDLPELSSYKVINSRIAIPFYFVKNKVYYFVISRNPYDLFFCSWGHNISSCFSMSVKSSYGFVRGKLPYIYNNTGGICYVTSGSVSKTSWLPEHKCRAPHMYWRAFFYVDANDKIKIGREYYDTSLEELKNSRVFNNFCRALFESPYQEAPLKGGQKVIDYACKNLGPKTYLDRIRVNISEATYTAIGEGYKGKQYLGTPLEECKRAVRILSLKNKGEDYNKFIDRIGGSFEWTLNY